MHKVVVEREIGVPVARNGETVDLHDGLAKAA